jgi:hypothetical protein
MNDTRRPTGLSARPGGLTAPQEGDVVVTRESSATVPYTVGQVPDVVQFRASARDLAIRLARNCAQQIAVDLWYREKDTYKLLEANRRRDS